MFEKYIELEPMRYYDKDADGLSENLRRKRQGMIDNDGGLCIATTKHDGEWAMFIKADGKIAIRSRSRGVSGTFGNFTEKLPHLVEEMRNWPENSVILGEVCVNQKGTTSRDVGAILRCLPAKAVEKQKNAPLIVYMFDCLAWDGVDYAATAYSQRLAYAQNAEGEFFKMTEIFDHDFAAAADNIIQNGGEGIVIQRRDNAYLSGTRTAWKSLKLKQKLPVMELQVVGTVAPNRAYNGQDTTTWRYWEGVTESGERALLHGIPTDMDCHWQPVTKPYYYGRKVGVVVSFNGNEVSATSGCTEELGDWLATAEAQELIAQGHVWAQIKSMMISATGESLRHPILVDVRVLNEHGE